jgi:hypothetical protein
LWIGIRRAVAGVRAPAAALDETPTELEFHPMTPDTVKVEGLEVHELALAFPAYKEPDMDKLTIDVRDHGMREPVTLYEGKILDGRNRKEAAIRAQLTTIPSKTFEGTYDEARNYVISLNLVRRHLTTGQRAMIAAELAKMPQGTRTDINIGQNCPMSNEAAAAALNVSPMTVKTAKAVKREDPALAEEVKQGKTKLSTAVRKTAALKTRPKITTAKKGPAKIEVKRHEERMKSARYKLEQFVRDYADMAEWKEVIEAIKTQLGAMATGA